MSKQYSKPKYAIMDNEGMVAILWETPKSLGNVLVIHKNNVNLQDGLGIHNCDTGKQENVIDLMDFLYECLPINHDQSNL